PPLGRQLWLPGMLAAAAGLVALLAPGLLADSARALVDPLAFVPSDAVRLTVAPGDATVLRGTPVTIRVQAAGRVPDGVEVLLWPEPAGEAEPAAAEPRRLAARGDGRGLFTAGPFPAERSLRYQARAGGHASPRYRLVVEEPPEVVRIAARYRYPAYLGRPDRRVEGGNVEAYLGTEVHLALEPNKPVAAGRLVFDDGRAQPLTVGPEGLSGTFVVNGEGGYRVVLTDRAGFETPEPIRYAIRVVPDHPPTAELREPGRDLTVDRGDVVHLEWAAADDLAVGAVDLVFDAGQGEQRVALARPRTPAETLAGRYDWRLAAWRLAPGTRVAYHVEARDTDDISGPKRGVSPTYTLEIRSREEEHEELRADLRELADLLLDALGDQLEREAAVQARDRAAAQALGRALDARLARAAE
ncbi:MAG TPA: hypothetical protein VNM66_09865, partial [Thermodesulfobacteriota bacterium]|nr:hypothetical protein [Thermodesulfobacteriota bacterium]